MRNGVFAMVMVAASVAGNGQAGAEVYDCAINVGASQNGFITNRYIFDFDAQAATVTVLDAVIQDQNKGPIAAKVASDTAKKLGFTWSIRLSTTTGQTIRMLYRASVIKATKAVQVSAEAQGGEYAGGFDARGACKLSN